MNKIDRRPDWDEYFMALAAVVASRSSCRHVRCGCVFTLDKMVMGVGYNGAPPGIANCLDEGCRKEKAGFSYRNSLNSGLCVGVHAEMNALANITRAIHREAVVYTTIFPCSTCTKTLLSYKISRLVYKREYGDEKENKTAKRLLKKAGVVVERLEISPKRVLDILFDGHEVDFGTFSKDELDRIKYKG